MVVAGAAPSLTSFRAASLPSSSWKLNPAPHKCQSTMLGSRVTKHSLGGTNLWPSLDLNKCDIISACPSEHWKPCVGWASGLLRKCGRNKKCTCHASLEGSVDVNYGANLQPEKLSSFDSQGIASDNEKADAHQSIENRGRSGIVSYFSLPPKEGEQASKKLEVPVQASNEAWVSVLWVLGPAVLLSSVVLPPFFLRKVFELLLEDSLVTDFLILFFTETLFYAGVFAFLLVAHKVQQATGVFTWNSGSRASLGYKISSYATMIFAVFLPLGAFAIVWPWTGPAAAAALLPYIAGLAVQYGFEQVVQDKKWSVWPLIPIIFQVYRLHQLNRATQLVAGLLYSLRGAEATAETLAVNGSLQTLVTVLQLLGMLCLWALTAYLTHVFSSESQDWQSRAVS